MWDVHRSTEMLLHALTVWTTPLTNVRSSGHKRGYVLPLLFPREKLNAVVWQSTESANGVTYDAGGTRVGLHVGFFFRKPIKIPSVRLGGQTCPSRLRWPYLPPPNLPQPDGSDRLQDAWQGLETGEGFTDWAFLPAAISWLCCWGLPRYQLQPASAQSPSQLTKTLESRALATPRGTSSCKARWLRQGTGQHPCLNGEASTAVVCSVEAQASHCRDCDL